MKDRSIFKNRTFVIVWAGQTVSVMGDILFNLALMWWVVQETGSGTAMSASALATALPRVLLGPVAGVIVDRFDRRKLMIFTNLANAAITSVMALIFFRGIFSLPLIVTAAGLIGVITTVHNPTFEATIPSIVNKDELIRVNSLMQSSRSVAGIVAPALSGFLIALFGVGASVAVKAVAFVLAAISLLLVSLPSPRVVSKQGLLRESMMGFRFISGHQLLWPLLLFLAVINLAMAPLHVAMPVLIVKVLAVGPALFGTFGSSQSLGILLGSTLLSAFPRLAARSGLVLTLSIIGMGGSLALIGFVSSALMLIPAGFFLGFAVVLAQVSSHAIWQRETPNEVRGRVFAARFAFSSALQPLGMAMSGPLVDRIGPASLLMLAGCLCALSGFLGFVVPGLTKYSSLAETPLTPAAGVSGQ